MARVLTLRSWTWSFVVLRKKVDVHLSLNHFGRWRLFPGLPSHGPQTWPWWRLVSFSVVKLAVRAPSTGWSLWWYTRWGAVPIDIYFDRRGLEGS